MKVGDLVIYCTGGDIQSGLGVLVRYSEGSTTCDVLWANGAVGYHNKQDIIKFETSEDI